MACLYAIMKYLKRIGYKQLGQKKRKNKSRSYCHFKKGFFKI